MFLDIFIVAAQQEVYLLSALGQPGTIKAADGSCSDNRIFHNWAQRYNFLPRNVRKVKINA